MKDTMISLFELAQMFETFVDDSFGGQYFWITAEISSINVRRGHCYLNLIEKDPGSTFPKAEMKGIIWQNHYERLNSKFSSITGFSLKQDISILFLASVQFSPRYGLSLNIFDIKGEFTLGEMMLERQKTIELLTEKGLYDRNKKLPMPEVPQRIAALSASDSKGFEDFLNIMDNNPHGFKFSVTLFPVMLQGNRAAESIATQLKVIEQQQKQFDVVVLVRGGGGNVDLHCFNAYILAEAIACSPLPVITGIGHTTDFTVADEVAAISRETPTAVAHHIVSTTKAFDEAISERSLKISRQTIRLLDFEYMFLESMASKLTFTPQKLLNNETIHLNRSVGIVSTHSLVSVRIAREKLTQAMKEIGFSCRRQMEKESVFLENTVQLIAANDPLRLLKKGFSLTRKNGLTVKDVSELNHGDRIETLTAGGTIVSTVEDTLPNTDQNQKTTLLSG